MAVIIVWTTRLLRRWLSSTLIRHHEMTRRKRARFLKKFSLTWQRTAMAANGRNAAYARRRWNSLQDQLSIMVDTFVASILRNSRRGSPKLRAEESSRTKSSPRFHTRLDSEVFSHVKSFHGNGEVFLLSRRKVQRAEHSSSGTHWNDSARFDYWFGAASLYRRASSISTGDENSWFTLHRFISPHALPRNIAVCFAERHEESEGHLQWCKIRCSHSWRLVWLKGSILHCNNNAHSGRSEWVSSELPAHFSASFR